MTAAPPLGCRTPSKPVRFRGTTGALCVPVFRSDGNIAQAKALPWTPLQQENPMSIGTILLIILIIALLGGFSGFGGGPFYGTGYYGGGGIGLLLIIVVLLVATGRI